MATTLSDLFLPLTSSASAVSGDMELFQFYSPLTDQIDPKGSNSVSQLLQKNGAAIDFSGLGAQAFQEALNVHVEITGKIAGAFSGASKALSHFGDTVKSLASHYDGQLNNIKGTDYAPGTSIFGGSSPVAEAARSAFMSLNPQKAMIDDVISGANGNAVLQNGPSDLLGLLGIAHARLIGQAAVSSISMPVPEANNATNQAQAQQMVEASLDALYHDVSQVYTNWGNNVHQNFTNFKTAMQTVTQTVQPYIDILNNKPLSAASIMAMIGLISQSNDPISIVQTGPNSIMVYISGTNAGKSGFGLDTNIWNALGTGMGMKMPYEQDVIAAIEQYSAEHGLVDPQITLAGHSLGGMVAQQIADQRIFNVKQVITFGSPVMGPPVRGVKYDLYEADSDAVPLLSRYENPSLPKSFQDVSNLFPAQAEVPRGNILSKGYGYVKDAGAALTDVHGLLYLRSEVKTMSPYLPPADTAVIGKLGPVGGGLADMALGVQPYAGPQAKLHYMDPTGAYKGELQRVPDLPTSLGLGVHSDYAQSPQLERQKIISPIKPPAGGVLSNVEYFGMPNEYQTAQINQHMENSSTIGSLLGSLGY
jgi:pimeloyl-ACP methyl ester carboxylesterase